MKQSQQTTLRAAVTLSGIGVHSGRRGQDRSFIRPKRTTASLSCAPASPGGHDRLIDARHLAVTATELCTVIGDRESGRGRHHRAPDGGPRRPRRRQRARRDRRARGSDPRRQRGSLHRRHRRRSASSPAARARRYLKVLKPVRVTQGKAFAELLPNERGFRLDVEIDFPTPVIGRQRKAVDLSPSRLPPRDLPRPHLRLHARRGEALERRLRARRLPREHGRHRRRRHHQPRGPALRRTSSSATSSSTRSAISSLAGLPLLGTYRSYCGGHRMNFSVLEALFSSRVQLRHRRRPRRAASRAMPSSARPWRLRAFAPEMH